MRSMTWIEDFASLGANGVDRADLLTILYDEI